MNYKFLSLLAFAICTQTSVQADTKVKPLELPKVSVPALKIGYVDIGYIFGNLPEAQKNTADMQSFKMQLDKQLRAKYDAYQEQAQLFQNEKDKLTKAQQVSKQTEINKLLTTAQEFEEQQYDKMANKYREVIKPLQDRMHEAIRIVAEEGAYTMVLNKNSIQTGEPLLLFSNESFDLSKVVLEKLKVMVASSVQPPVVGRNNASTKSVAPEKKK